MKYLVILIIYIDDLLGSYFLKAKEIMDVLLGACELGSLKLVGDNSFRYCGKSFGEEYIILAIYNNTLGRLGILK